jgi:hypothetical protein
VALRLRVRVPLKSRWRVVRSTAIDGTAIERPVRDAVPAGLVAAERAIRT